MGKAETVRWESDIRRTVLDDYDKRYESVRDVELMNPVDVWRDVRWLVDRLRETRPAHDTEDARSASLREPLTTEGNE